MYILFTAHLICLKMNCESTDSCIKNCAFIVFSSLFDCINLCELLVHWHSLKKKNTKQNKRKREYVQQNGKYVCTLCVKWITHAHNVCANRIIEIVRFLFLFKKQNLVFYFFDFSDKSNYFQCIQWSLNFYISYSQLYPNGISTFNFHIFQIILFHFIF